MVVLGACDGGGEPTRGPSSAPVSTLDRWTLTFDAKGTASAAELPGTRTADGALTPVAAERLREAFASVAQGQELTVETVPGDDGSDGTLGAPVALVLRAPEARYRAVLRGGATGTDGATVLADDRVAAVLGSPFVAEFSPLRPLGLLKVEGAEIGPLQPYGYTRIIGFGEQGLGVVNRGAYHRDLFESALQAGPGIVERGQLDISERELKLPAYFRTFVARCDGALLFGATVRPVHLRHLGAHLLRYFTAQDLQCAEVVNLSGDRETLLGLRAGDRAAVFGNPRVRKTALLALILREPLPEAAAEQSLLPASE